MPSTTVSVLAAIIITALAAALPAGAVETCVAGPALVSGRLAGTALVTGTVRPVVTLSTSLGTPTTDAPIVVPLAGILVPAVADSDSRAGFAAAVGSFAGADTDLFAATDGPDRRGRRPGVLVVVGGISLQQHLLAAGLAVADTSYQPCTELFLAAEHQARAEKRGIWRQSRLWTEMNLAAGPGLPDFVLGRGRVASVGRAGRTTYINFGDHYRTDATVRIGDAVAAALAAAGRPPAGLSGRWIEVRGWARQSNGLDMELLSPQALRLVGEHETDSD